MLPSAVPSDGYARGIDDHSRFVVIAKVVQRATARAVCLAFGEGLMRFGVPEEVLTVAWNFGHIDLATVAPDRLAWTASRADEPRLGSSRISWRSPVFLCQESPPERITAARILSPLASP
ncbi:hypothetical protein TNCT6_41620 [Streptomyces sp. 6-11-2]|nr:hypothetical protein TNCT6_41620 [Streptomyces sp. 6-11-2]